MSGIKLPDGWYSVSIGEICSKVTDGSHNPPKASVEGLPMLSAKNIHDGIIDFSLKHRLIPEEEFISEDKRTNIEKDNILLTIVGTLGRTAVVTENIPKFTLQRSVAVLAALHMDSRSFRYSLEEHNFQQQLIDNAKGTAQKGIYLKKLRDLTLPLPPLAEQKIIADKLDTLLAQVETTKARLERIPEILKRFRQSVLAAAVSGRLTEEWREGSPFATSMKIGELSLDIRYGSSKKCSEDEGNTAVLRIPNIGDGIVDPTDLKYADFDPKEVEKLHLKLGDILLIRSNGSVDLVGKLAVVREPDLNYLFAGYLIRIRPDTSKINSFYQGICLRSPALRAIIENLARSTSGVNNINSKELASLEIPVPSIEEQTQIVRRVEELFTFANNIEQKANAALERVNNLTQSILAKAFRGELTADWRAANPELISGENSAKALLAKIKAEREALAPKKGSRAKKNTQAKQKV